ncbi:MAG: hypothetical protein ABSB15_24340 [Bryobacteraceae bacterium]|jgi:hypothetical protein
MATAVEFLAISHRPAIIRFPSLIAAYAGSPEAGYGLQDAAVPVFNRIDIRRRQDAGSDPAAENVVARKDPFVEDGNVQA